MQLCKLPQIKDDPFNGPEFDIFKMDINSNLLTYQPKSASSTFFNLFLTMLINNSTYIPSQILLVQLLDQKFVKQLSEW